MSRAGTRGQHFGLRERSDVTHAQRAVVQYYKNCQFQTIIFVAKQGAVRGERNVPNDCHEMGRKKGKGKSSDEKW